MEGIQYEIGYTIRSRRGRGRIEYNPIWSPSKPFLTFYRGEAGLQFHSLVSAIDYMNRRFNLTFYHD